MSCNCENADASGNRAKRGIKFVFLLILILFILTAAIRIKTRFTKPACRAGFNSNSSVGLHIIRIARTKRARIIQSNGRTTVYDVVHDLRVYILDHVSHNPRTNRPTDRILYSPARVEMEQSFSDVSGNWWETRTDCETCRTMIPMSLSGKLAGASITFKLIEHLRVCKKGPFKKGARVGNGAPSGAFAFTLTKSPKDALSIGDMLTAVRKIMQQKSCPVKKYAWYYEEKGRDENGDPIHPHIHGIYETESGGRIESKHFKRAWPIWDPSKPMGQGFKGGYHRAVRSDEGYSDYIKKDGGMSESYGMDEQTE